MFKNGISFDREGSAMLQTPLPPSGKPSLKDLVQKQLDTYRTEKVVATREMRDSFGSQVEVALKQLQRRGHETEVNEYLELLSRAEKESPQLAKQVMLKGH